MSNYPLAVDSLEGRRNHQIKKITSAVAASVLLVAALAPLTERPANAAATGIGPISDLHGFPEWFSDGEVALALCYEAGKGCLEAPPDPTAPVTYPGNFPDEAFWFAAEASGGKLGLYEAALEAAHVNETPAVGDQMGFGRLRFRLDALQANAAYTITHPYGVHTFNADATGVINVTLDEGCAGDPCDWNQVAQGFLGDYTIGVSTAFIKQIGAPAGTIGEVANERPVTGAPSGNNFVQVAGPNAGGPGINTLTVNTFAIQGVIADGAPSTPAPSTPVPVKKQKDMNGDGNPDLVARDAAGALWLYPSTSAGGFGTWTQIGTGWGSMNAILQPGDFSGDGHSDIMARDTSGRLWLYTGTGTGRINGGVQVGTGWSGMTALVTPGDFNGDSRADLLARDAAGGLHLYPGNGASGWGVPTQPGVGWQGMTALVSSGDFSGDGRADVIARNSAGALFLYRGNGTGGFGASNQIGTGWNDYHLVGTGAWGTADSNSDIVARDSSGALWLYHGAGTGAFTGARTLIGSGWNSYTMVQ